MFVIGVKSMPYKEGRFLSSGTIGKSNISNAGLDSPGRN